MKDEGLQPTSNRKVFSVLWKAAKLRKRGRAQRQRELTQRKTGSPNDVLASIGAFFLFLLCLFVHAMLAWQIVGSSHIALEIEEQRQGRLIVPSWMDQSITELRKTEARIEALQSELDSPGLPQARQQLEQQIEEIADRLKWRRANDLGGDRAGHHAYVIEHLELHGSSGIISEDAVPSNPLKHPEQLPDYYWIFVAGLFVWWFLLLICQGEGLDLDIQRRRHPHWEWLLSHPVRPIAAFSAEMLSPLMANPIYFSAPIFWAVIFSQVMRIDLALLCAVVVGLLFAVACSLLNKSIEFCTLLRLPPRHRGAIIGITSWIGYIAMIIPLFFFHAKPIIHRAMTLMAERQFPSIATVPAKALLSGWNLEPSWWQITISAACLACVLAGCAALITLWATRNGLYCDDVQTSIISRQFSGSGSLIRNPCFKKEILWLWRVKGAVIQALLIPLTIGTIQAFNLRHLAGAAMGQWNYFCGLGVICGTYFLLVLGPRSLTSEGSALWIAQTWPRSLESLLEAKSRLWWAFSSAIVTIFFVIALFQFPADWWKIVLVALGWTLFSRALAMKSVTLVTAPSSSGEMEAPPAGRRWAAMIGTFAFGSGVLTENWHIAAIGVIFSLITAATMWQNLRARLPYLFDPWSEKVPEAPSLMQAMIATAIMAELVASSLAVGSVLASEHMWMIQTLSYGLIGLVVWVVTHAYLETREVRHQDLYLWEHPGISWKKSQALAISTAAAGILGAFALGYVQLLNFFPAAAETLQRIAADRSEYAEGLWWQLILVAGLVPFVEEFFFRGLLYRALDREYGGWKAILMSSAFFTVYHPPLSWIPVFLLGIAAAVLFKRSGFLFPSIALHMVYNFLVVWFQK